MRGIEELQILAQKIELPITIDLEQSHGWPKWHMTDVKWLNIHNAGTKQDGKGLHNYNRYCIRTCGDGVKSWHWSVGEDGAYQGLDMTLASWQAGDGDGEGNTASVSIEIGRDLLYTDLYAKAEDNGAKLAAVLLTYFGFPLDHMVPHKHWMAKQCPHRILNEGRWEEFVSKVRAYMKMLKDHSPQVVYRVQLGAFRSKKGAEQTVEAYKQIIGLPEVQKILKPLDLDKTKPYIPEEET